MAPWTWTLANDASRVTDREESFMMVMESIICMMKRQMDDDKKMTGD